MRTGGGGGPDTQTEHRRVRPAAAAATGDRMQTRKRLQSRVRLCPSCDRPLPPEASACPYCGDLAPPSRAGRLLAACAVGAVICITAAWTLTRPSWTDAVRLPATHTAGLLLAAGVALLFTPLHWRGIPSATRRDRLAALLRHLACRFSATLAALAALAAIRAAPSPPAIALACAALLLTATACAIARDARIGFLAGLCIGLA